MPFPPKTSWEKLGCTLYVRKRDPQGIWKFWGGAVAALVPMALRPMAINTATSPPSPPITKFLDPLGAPFPIHTLGQVGTWGCSAARSSTLSLI